jgi:hypothetical protein
MSDDRKEDNMNILEIEQKRIKIELKELKESIEDIYSSLEYTKDIKELNTLVSLLRVLYLKRDYLEQIKSKLLKISLGE